MVNVLDIESWPMHQLVQAKEFEAADYMTRAVARGELRGFVLAGDPGLGKSYTIHRALHDEDEIKKANKDDPNCYNRWSVDGVWNPTYKVIKGRITPASLYRNLSERRWPGDVLVLDDADSIFNQEDGLNILKAALDTDEVRKISWATATKENEATGGQFDYYGGVIVITNIDHHSVENARIKQHIAALESRCFWLSLSMRKMDEKFARMRGLLDQGHFLNDIQEPEEVFDFMVENRDNLKELSLRTALKIGQLKTLWPDNWKEMSANTCFNHKF